MAPWTFWGIPQSILFHPPHVTLLHSLCVCCKFHPNRLWKIFYTSSINWPYHVQQAYVELTTLITTRASPSKTTSIKFNSSQSFITWISAVWGWLTPPILQHSITRGSPWPSPITLPLILLFFWSKAVFQLTFTYPTYGGFHWPFSWLPDHCCKGRYLQLVLFETPHATNLLACCITISS